ncbi:Iron-sulfur cluster carrier protein [subsurface metagenome]
MSSGKGGVGKSITATNLAIYYAKKGLRIALLDIDPLSDISTIMDLPESELSIQSVDSENHQDKLADHVINLFNNLDLVFPEQKLKGRASLELLEKIFGRFSAEFDRNYDLLILDMPAGSNYEDNLAFLPFIHTLILVTNPEPTAHASAGAYIKNVLARQPDRMINIWHNRYSRETALDFNPRDVVGNYNKNVIAEEKLTVESSAKIRDFAFIPEDPSMNLLRGNPNISANILYNLLNTLEALQEERLHSEPLTMSVSPKTAELVKYYISRNKKIENIDTYIRELGSYLKNLAVIAGAGSLSADTEVAEVFSYEQSKNLKAYIERVQKNLLRQSIIRVLSLVEEKKQQAESSNRIFLAGAPAFSDKILDREISRLLIDISRLPSLNPTVKNLGSLLLFYFALYKLFQSETVVALISTFIPQRENNRGIKIRDRKRQIRILIEKDNRYRQQYYRLIKMLYSIINKQLATVTRAFQLQNLIFRNEKNELVGKAYLTLLTNFIHETIYGGLSIIIDFDYRPASIAFQRGAEKLLKLL